MRALEKNNTIISENYQFNYHKITPSCFETDNKSVFPIRFRLLLHQNTSSFQVLLKSSSAPLYKRIIIVSYLTHFTLSNVGHTVEVCIGHTVEVLYKNINLQKRFSCLMQLMNK